jgi:uncharacterized membrane protein YccC
MSLGPEQMDPQPVEALPDRAATWSHRLGTLLFVLFCFEIGVFLLVFPWLDPWQNNWLADVFPGLAGVWGNPFFRGALSGLGFVNIYISLLEVFRIKRIA